jgi:GNAT superfamily N-acetyltransferase
MADPMPEGRLRIRRARRTDFTAVMQLLTASAMPVPPPDRATLRRFRHLVADLGTDFYLASVDGTVAGLVHVTYARQLAIAPSARVDQLMVAQVFRRHGIGSALLAFARQRARWRGCGTLSCAVPGNGAGARRFLDRQGLRPNGEWYGQELMRDAEH